MDSNYLILNNMIKKIYYSKSSKFIITLLLITSTGLLDYLTGKELGFFVFYYIPIFFATWYLDIKWSVTFSILSAFIWAFVDFVSRHSHPSWPIIFWNGGIRLLSFLIIAIAISKINQLLTKEQNLTRALQLTLDEVKQLKGFIPICASCKNIRNDSGYWEQVDQYVKDHSDAEFTHTLCPDCAKKLYPNLDISP